MGTVINQQLDAVTMANSVKLLTRDQKLMTRPFVPNQPLYTDDMEGVRELTGQKNVMPEIQTLGVLQAIGERVGGQSDPNFGRETRMGGHPQPATKLPRSAGQLASPQHPTHEVHPSRPRQDRRTPHHPVPNSSRRTATAGSTKSSAMPMVTKSGTSSTMTKSSQARSASMSTP